nr:deoxyribodipyrimidine photo-lyase [Paenibacillus turpanensis]
MRAFDYIAARNRPSLHVFILDPALLNGGREQEHSGRAFLGRLQALGEEYRRHGKQLQIVYGEPRKVLSRLLDLHPVEEVVVQREHTPYAAARDHVLRLLAESRGTAWTAIEDGTLVDGVELQAYGGRKEPYKVFTPFYRKWSEYLSVHYRPSSAAGLPELEVTAEELAPAIAESFALPFPLEAYASSTWAEAVPREVLRRFLESGIDEYAARRDFYAGEGTSGLSVYINTGAISIREIYEALPDTVAAEPWRRQLAWRDFYYIQAACSPAFFRYESLFDLSGLSDLHFEAWAEARTGIPIIDAAMTQLLETGVMPNRLRMITAMFLTKNLLCPFPLGEQLFRRKLADYDNILNRGGWLWSASLGYDASPYFRIMNPVAQSERYDPDGEYIRRWLPQLRALSGKAIHRPQPNAIVDLAQSREHAIAVYRSILGSKSTLPLE